MASSVSSVASFSSESCLALTALINEATRKIGINLKEKQLEAIQMFCIGRDVFVSLPTGHGKSLIYGLLPLVYNSLKGQYGRCHFI